MAEVQSRRLFFMLKICALLSLACSGPCFGQSKWNLIDTFSLVYPISTINVTYGDGKFVAVVTYYYSGFDDNVVFTSSDASNWTTKDYAIPSSYINSVNYYNGKFLAVGSHSYPLSGYWQGVIYTSSDASTWASKSPGDSGAGGYVSFCSAIYAKGMFVITGTSGDVPVAVIATSTDAEKWTTKTIPAAGFSLSSVTYGGSQFVAVGYAGGILTSPDALTWTVKKLTVSSSNLNSVTYGDSQFVAVGSGGGIFTSQDAVTWTMRNTGTAKGLHCITYGNGQFVVVGDSGIILTSPDAKAWTMRNSGTTSFLRSVTYGDSLFVAVGTGGTILTSRADKTGIAVQPKFNMHDNNRIKVKSVNNGISVILPNASVSNRYKIELFTVAGKKAYSATSDASNGVFYIPALCFSAGMYYISIEDNHINGVSSAFVLAR